MLLYIIQVGVWHSKEIHTYIRIYRFTNYNLHSADAHFDKLSSVTFRAKSNFFLKLYMINHLACFLADLDPVEAAVIRLVDDTATAVKTKDIVADTARPSWLHLVFVSEKLLAGVAAAVVQLSVSQNTKECALAGINISNHCHPVTTSMDINLGKYLEEGRWGMRHSIRCKGMTGGSGEYGRGCPFCWPPQ